MVIEMTLFVNSVSVGLQYGGSFGPCMMTWMRSSSRVEARAAAPASAGSYVDCHDPWEVGMVMSVGVLTAVLLPFLYIGLLSIGTMLEDPMGADASDEPALYNHFALQTALDDIDSTHDCMEDERFLPDAIAFSARSPFVRTKIRASGGRRAPRRARDARPEAGKDATAAGAV